MCIGHSKTLDCVKWVVIDVKVEDCIDLQNGNFMPVMLSQVNDGPMASWCTWFKPIRD